MISDKIKQHIERHPGIEGALGRDKYGTDWGRFPRTAFETVARVINNDVTGRVLQDPALVEDLVIIGADELESTYFKNGLSSIDEFLRYLESHSSFRPFNWVSGKSLHSYWHGGTAKEKKYNVLLAFVEPNPSRWPEWKTDQEHQPRSNDNSILRKHFLGHYQRYYRKTDGSKVLIRAPFIIRDDAQLGVVVETKTIGHEYRSSYAAIREGAFYVDCENMSWNERETHIYNIGFESNPELVMGISNTLDKRKQAIAVANILVRVKEPYVYDRVNAEEIPFDEILPDDSILFPVMNYLMNSGAGCLSTPYYHTLRELEQAK